MSDLRRVCMLSVHGYFDPEPILGATDTGGQVTYVLELSKSLAALGMKVDIFTRRFDGRSEMAPVNEDVRVIRIPCGGHLFIRKEDLFPHLDEYVDNMDEYIRDNGLDYPLLHAHYWDAGYAAMKLAQRLGKVFIYTAHSLGAWKKEQMGGDPDKMEKLFKFSERIHWENIIFRRATAQTVTTIDGKETYRRLYDFESPDLEVIPPGVDIGRFRPLDKDESDKELEVPERFIFSLSRIDSNKGIDYLIRAFALASEKTDACLVIGGGSKNPKDHEIEVKSDLERLVAELGLEERVRFTGYIPDEQLEVYYRKAQLFVLPSKYEPFGMTVLEAMACGTPVVATRLGGLRNVLHDGEDSLLVDPSDPDELSTTISRMLSDRKLASRLAENGMRLVREQYSWDGIAKRTLSFYRRYL